MNSVNVDVQPVGQPQPVTPTATPAEAPAPPAETSWHKPTINQLAHAIASVVAASTPPGTWQHGLASFTTTIASQLATGRVSKKMAENASKGLSGNDLLRDIAADDLALADPGTYIGLMNTLTRRQEAASQAEYQNRMAKVAEDEARVSAERASNEAANAARQRELASQELALKERALDLQEKALRFGRIEKIGNSVVHTYEDENSGKPLSKVILTIPEGDQRESLTNSLISVYLDLYSKTANNLYTLYATGSLGNNIEIVPQLAKQQTADVIKAIDNLLTKGGAASDSSRQSPSTPVDDIIRQAGEEELQRNPNTHNIYNKVVK